MTHPFGLIEFREFESLLGIFGKIIWMNPMHILATTVSAKVLSKLGSHPWQGSVRAIFQRSFHVEMPGRWLIHIGTEDFPPNPRSLLLPAKDYYEKICPNISAGLPAMGQNGMLDFPRIRLRISTPSARIFDPRFPPAECFLPAGEILENLRRVFVRRGSHPFPMAKSEKFHGEVQGFSAQLHSALVERIESFLSALASREWAKIRENIRAIIGLGPGLTPSGDDFLAGFIASGMALGRGYPKIWEFIRKVADLVVEESRERTTTVSLAIFEDAAEGEMAEPLIHLLQGLLLTGNSAKIPHLVSQVLNMGAFSGEDALSGVAAGILFFFAKVAPGPSPSKDGG